MFIQVTPFQKHEYNLVLEAIGSGLFFVHQHIDWEPLHKWLYDPKTSVYLAWKDQMLQGVLAFSPPQAESSWLRLLALPNPNALDLFLSLWNAALGKLDSHIKRIGAMPSDEWIMPLLEAVGFAEIEQVVHLTRNSQPLLNVEMPPQVTLKQIHWYDFKKITELDHQAFEDGLWQLRETELREASHHAFKYTVARLEREIVGYQITMRYGKTLHLSRLAVSPCCQNKLVGTKLLADMLAQAEQIGIYHITVNTQVTNHASRRLYERWGFEYEEHVTRIYGVKRS